MWKVDQSNKMIMNVLLWRERVSDHISTEFLTKGNRFGLDIKVLLIFCITQGTIKPFISTYEEIFLFLKSLQNFFTYSFHIIINNSFSHKFTITDFLQSLEFQHIFGKALVTLDHCEQFLISSIKLIIVILNLQNLFGNHSVIINLNLILFRTTRDLNSRAHL